MTEHGCSGDSRDQLFQTRGIGSTMTDAAAGILFVLALVTALRAAAVSVRRRLIFLALGLAVASLTLVWLSRSGAVVVPMAYVIAISREVPEEALRNELRKLPPQTPVAFIEIATKAGPDGESSWCSAGKWLLAGDETALVDACLAGAARVSTSEEGWGGDLVSKAAARVRERWFTWLWREPALLVLRDDGLTWQGAEPTLFRTGEAVEALAQAGSIRLVTKDVRGSRSSGSLVLVPGDEAIPEADRMVELSGAYVHMDLHNPPTGLQPSSLRVRAHVDVVTQDENGLPQSGQYVLADVGAVLNENVSVAAEFKPVTGSDQDVLRWKLDLNAFRWAGDGPAMRISPGIHRLSASVHAQVDDGRELSFESETYLVVRERRILILARESLEEQPRSSPLTNDGWFLPSRVLKRAVPRDLIQSYFDKRSGDQFYRTPRFPIEHFTLPDSTTPEEDLAKLVSELDRARGVVLLEPAREHLEFLDDSLGMDQRIQDGLNVLVAGPPVAPIPPEWLPATARGSSAPARNDEPVMVHGDGRLYVLFDTSRFMRSTFRDEDNSPLELQVMAANSMLRSLGFDSSSASYSIEEDRVVGPSKPVALLYDREDADPDPIDIKPDALTLGVAPTFLNRDRSRHLQGPKDYTSGQPSAYLLDIAAGNSGARIASLFRPFWAEETDRFASLIPGDLYPETHVILFRTAFDQEVVSGRVSAALNKGDPGPVGTFDGIGELPTQGDLLAAGVHVHVINISRHAPRFEQALRSAQVPDVLVEPAWKFHPAGAAREDLASNLTWAVADGDFDRKGQELAGRILRTPSSLIRRAPGGRDIDQRTDYGIDAKPATVPAPEHQRLLNIPPDKFRTPSATVSVGAGDEQRPVVVSKVYGEGQVLVLAYSPFAPDVWLRDVWDAASPALIDRTRPSSQRRFQGWGIQRLIDFVSLNGSVEPRPRDRLAIGNAQVTAGGSTLSLQLLADPDGGSWEGPQLIFSPRDVRPLELTRRNTSTGELTFKLHTKTLIEGPAILQHGVGAETPIFVSLAGQIGPSGDIGQVLRTTAELSGGSLIQEEEPIPISSTRAAPWLPALILTISSLFVMSPAVVPWTGLTQWLARRKQRLRVGQVLDVDDILSEWGVLLGRPTTERVAGVPGAERRFESGDRLNAARISSLIPFTVLSESLGLPKRPPLVRVRHMTHATNALILLDHTHSLATPRFSPHPTKTELAQFICGIVAGVTWMRDGSVSLISTSRVRSLDFGPSLSLASMDDIRRAARKMTEEPHAARTGISLSDDIEERTAVYLITDVPSRSPSEVARLVSTTVSKNLSLRVIQVSDPEEINASGLGRFAGTSTFVDRLDANRDTVQASYLHDISQTQQILSAENVPSVHVSSDLPPGEMVQMMVEAGVFET